MNTNALIAKFWVEDLHEKIFSILNTATTDSAKLHQLGEQFRPRLDYIKADILIKSTKYKLKGHNNHG